MASSKWVCTVDPRTKVATLSCTMDDGFRPVHTFPVKLRGVCYSPCPINASNKEAPALGDWYWDSFQAGPDTISGWQDLWRRDNPGLQAVSANTIRVYSMLSRQLTPAGPVPDPWNSGHLFTHKAFLDLCWDINAPPEAQRTKFVLVGIPLPATMFWKQQYDQQSQATITYWTEVLRETAQQVGSHPVVMGFIILNEHDGADVCYKNPDWAKFWWSQANKFAGIVRQVAPGKIVGMATHDDPNIPNLASAYMANCPNIDFWGVNSYQTSTLAPTIDPYTKMSSTALKPVILTEYGIPATTRRVAGNPGSIYDDATTDQKAAAVVGRVAPQAFTNPLCLGMYYFEYCDEWWNQPEAPNIYTWWSGPPAPGFPNGYWDNDGFGLHSTRRGPGLKPNDSPWDRNGPRKPIDVQTRRPKLFDTLATAFRNAK